MKSERSIVHSIKMLLIVRVQRRPNSRSCSDQLCGRERTSPLTVTPAGTSPLAMAPTMRGDRKASGAKNWMWRTTFCSRSAISSKDLIRPSMRSSIQERALAIAVSSASRSRGSRSSAAGRWMTPFRRRATGGDQGMLIDCCSPPGAVCDASSRSSRSSLKVISTARGRRTMRAT